ncbi:MAG: FkbM family methyltransferase [Anaerolineae bacterium]|nr:FkbM family methyltransferase [Anaerolineae bacterium]
MLVSRWRYYLSSIPTLLLRFHDLPVILAAFLGLPRPKPFLVRLKNGCQFYVRGAIDIWIIKETVLDRDYEVHGVPVQDGWTVLDIGAGLGDFAISVAREHPHCRVIAFEPFAESYALLQQNLALNNVTTVQAFPHAIGSGQIQLQTASGIAVKHSTAQVASSVAADAGESGPGMVDVQSKTLAQVFADLDIARCDFLKMDCEGAEYAILLECSPETLRQITHISLEYHDDITPYSHRDLAAFLRDAGFEVCTIPNPAHREIGFLAATRAPHCAP